MRDTEDKLEKILEFTGKKLKDWKKGPAIKTVEGKIIKGQVAVEVPASSPGMLRG